MVENKEERCGAGPEVLQVSSFNAQGAVAALVWDGKGIVVDLVPLDMLQDNMCSLTTYLVAQLARQP